MTVYICVTDLGYCHAVFSNIVRAQRFCDSHPTYHVIVRELDKIDEYSLIDKS